MKHSNQLRYVWTVIQLTEHEELAGAVYELASTSPLDPDIVSNIEEYRSGIMDGPGLFEQDTGISVSEVLEGAAFVSAIADTCVANAALFGPLKGEYELKFVEWITRLRNAAPQTEVSFYENILAFIDNKADELSVEVMN